MALADRRISFLKQELLELIGCMDDFNGSPGLDVYSPEDLDERQDLMQKPAFGISYQGSAVVDNEATAAARDGIQSAALITLYFQVIVVVEYTGGFMQNSVPDATDVLDAIRTTVYGYRGIGSRVWKFVGEIPYKVIGDGTVYYLQDWKTDIPLVGTSTT